jgi:hypothetical protein
MKAIKIFPRKYGIETKLDNFGLVCASIPYSANTKVGPLRRKIVLRYSARWIDGAPNVAPEERATVAEFRLWLSEQNVTMHLSGGNSHDHLTIALYPLAEGLVHDWWSLFGGRDREFSLTGYRTGYAMPDVRFRFDGRTFEASAHQRTYRNPDVRFWAGSNEVMSRADAEGALSEFIGEVLAQLESRRVRDAGAALRWSRVQASRADPEETEFCECAGALGLDPYSIDQAGCGLIQSAASLFEDEPLTEFLAGTKNYAATPILDWINQAESRPKPESRIADLSAIAQGAAERAPDRAGEDGWALGYRRARTVRQLMNINESRRFRSIDHLAKQFGADDAFSPAARTDGIRALRSQHDDEVHIHMRNHGTSADADAACRFSFARAIGDVACFPSAGRAAVNELHYASRQAAGRAFAAEFLAPVNEIESMRRDGHDLVTIADEFAVSTVVVERQIENASRIAKACQK